MTEHKYPKRASTEPKSYMLITPTAKGVRVMPAKDWRETLRLVAQARTYGLTFEIYASRDA